MVMIINYKVFFYLRSMNNRITELFNIEFPIIQGGMIWCSNWQLVAAVSEAGGLGLLGSGSMYPAVLKEHIQKAKGMNIPSLVYVVNDFPRANELFNYGACGIFTDRADLIIEGLKSIAS